MSARIDIPEDKVAEFCRRNGIKCLSLFGSGLRRGGRPESRKVSVFFKLSYC